jgi:predicted enzyme related to lactoylglutathione lyase
MMSVANLKVVSVAIQTSRHDAMKAFYADAFGVQFRQVQTGPIESSFGTIGALTLKLVPIRAGVDFEGFAVHQLELEVPDIAEVIQIAERHGGRVYQAAGVVDGSMRASIRDPDGNTIELTSRSVAEA